MKVESGKNFLRGVFENKKSLLILLGSLIFANLALLAFTYNFGAFKVLEFIFLAVYWGLAPAYFFRAVLKIENVTGWLVNAGVLGVLTIPFVFLFAGWVGFNFVFVHSTWFIYLCAFLGITGLFIYADKNSLAECINLKGIRTVDLAITFIFLAFTYILTLLNFNQLYPRWDAFTYWGLDAKYLYQYNHLRDAKLDVFTKFRYTSYYPIFYSIIYHIYGNVLEQYASWINVFINFLAMMLVYNKALKKSTLQKVLIAALLLVTSYGAIDAAYMFSMFAEVISAFCILVFMSILTDENGYSLEAYGKRMLLLLLSALSLYFLKSPNLSLTCALLAVWLIYDAQFLLQNWNELIKRANVIGAAAIFVTLYLLRYYYFATLLKIGSETPLTDLLDNSYGPLNTLIGYIADLIPWMLKTSPYLVGCWLVGFVSIIVLWRKKVKKNYLFVYLVSISIFLFYCSVYIVYQQSLQSGSLVRYTTIVMYLVPLMFCRLEIQLPGKVAMALIAAASILSLFIFIKAMTPMPLLQSFEIASGSYAAALPDHWTLARKVLAQTGAKSRILIANDDHASSMASNEGLPDIFIRYYLMNNSVGGQYMDLPINDLYDYAIKFKADDILLLSYDNTLDFCGGNLNSGDNYLLPIDKKTSCTGPYCICSSLAKAVDFPAKK